MGFEPTECSRDAPSLICDAAGARWQPIVTHACNFPPDAFVDVVMNHIKNPNINSSWLFRADILLQLSGGQQASAGATGQIKPQMCQFEDFDCHTVIVRKLVPRNPRRDDPLDQTCLLYSSQGMATKKSLLVYLPHVSSVEQMPFYHPRVKGIAFLHEWTPADNSGAVSVHYHLFDGEGLSTKSSRTALALLKVLHKHGESRLTGYVKKVNHDSLVPQARVQNRYTELKQRYAKDLVETWQEDTDPEKHVFEDLCIAAFLIELWRDTYGDDQFPGFVDIGCGNGLLVHILNKAGYRGWGFDARARKSWKQYNSKVKLAVSAQSKVEEGDALRQLLLLPSIIDTQEAHDDTPALAVDGGSLHDGRFLKGTFIISNHADELTPWTPILATMSESPFIMIPCCSHNLTGAKYRAPPPKDKTKSSSAYSSLVEWVHGIAQVTGWEVERESLRIPSTRNIAVIGRKRSTPASSVDIGHVVRQFGGAQGYYDNVAQLCKAMPRGH